MILQLLQEFTQEKSWEMETHSAFFFQQQDLAKKLAEAQVVGGSSHKDF